MTPPAWLGVTCPRCGAQPGRRCHSSGGRTKSTPHAARETEAYVPPTPDELIASERARRLWDAQHHPMTRATVSLAYSCGCTEPASEPIPVHEINPLAVGTPIICDRHQEYAVTVRSTIRLVPDVATLKRLLVAGDVEPDVADYVARDQADTLVSRILRSEVGGPT